MKKIYVLTCSYYPDYEDDKTVDLIVASPSRAIVETLLVEETENPKYTDCPKHSYDIVEVKVIDTVGEAKGFEVGQVVAHVHYPKERGVVTRIGLTSVWATFSGDLDDEVDFHPKDLIIL